MQIKSIKISNILTFEDKPIDECEEIKFTGGLNLLIGPNGTGKSNFIEIINTIFKKALFIQYQSNESHFQASDDIRRLSFVIQNLNTNLAKNHNSTNDMQTIELIIELNDHDHQNIDFMIRNKDFLNQLITTYTRFDLIRTENYAKEQTIKITFNRTILRHNTNFSASSQNQLILYYLKNFYLLQELIKIANKIEHKKWPMLKNTFALIGSNRNYADFNTDIIWLNNADKDAKRQFMNAFTDENALSSNTEPIVFSFVRYRFAEYLHEFINKSTTGNIGQHKNAIDNIKDQEYYKRINEPVKNILGLDMNFELDGDTMIGKFYYSSLDRKFSDIQILSSGEKSILQLIYSLYGYDLKNGLFLIDEPEIHLHPQWQERYLRLILKEIEDRKLQIILVTHSPFFIDEKTIYNVHRFFISNYGFTGVTSPDFTQSYEKHMMDFLIVKNIQKYLFSDKIVLVTAEHLETFFKLYYKNYLDKTLQDKKLEFLYVDQNSLQYIVKFLNQFNLKLYSINIDKIDNISTFDLQNLDEFLLNISNRNTQAVIEYFSKASELRNDPKYAEINADVDKILEKILADK